MFSKPWLIGVLQQILLVPRVPLCCLCENLSWNLLLPSNKQHWVSLPSFHPANYPTKPYAPLLLHGGWVGGGNTTLLSMLATDSQSVGRKHLLLNYILHPSTLVLLSPTDSSQAHLHYTINCSLHSLLTLGL